MEVLGIYFTAPVAMVAIRRLLGVSVTNPLNHLTAHASNAELLAASRGLFALLIMQYAGYFLFAVPLNWWYRRRGRADYGITRARHSWKLLLLSGLATAALCEWPILGITVANSIHPGPTAAWRQAFLDMSWLRWQFWLFAGVLSWAGAPFFEELFYRGYCQRRLAEDWGDGPAILGAACLFTFSHAQYFRLDLYNVSMVIGLLLAAIGFGAIFAWTRSLIPCMIAHALFDIPMTTFWQTLFLAGLVIGAAAVWRRAGGILKQLFPPGILAPCAALGIIAAVYAIIASRDELALDLLPVAIAILIAAVIVEAKDRRRERAPNRIAAKSPG